MVLLLIYHDKEIYTKNTQSSSTCIHVYLAHHGALKIDISRLLKVAKRRKMDDRNIKKETT